MKLKDVCHLIVDCPHTTAIDEGEGIPLIRTPNIGKGRFELADVHRISESVYTARTSRAVPQDNDIIFAREAPAGNAAIIKNGQKMCLGQRTVLIRPDKSKVDADFLVYYLLATEQQYKLLGTANGATVAHVNLPTIRDMNVDNLPDFPVQQSIGHCLSAYDDLIENNRKQIALLEEAAQRLYKEWFVDFRFLGHETAEWENGLPKGWKEGQAQDFFDISIGKTPPRAEKKCFSTKHGIKWASISDMGSGDVYLFDTSEFLTEEAVREYHVKVIPTGSVLLSFKLTVGRIAITTEDITTNEAIAHFRITEEKIREYVYFYLKNFSYSTLGSTSSIAKAINSKIVKALPFCIPDDITLAKFSQKIMPLFNRIRILLKQNRNMTVTRDALLPRLMSGEIEVTA